MKYEIGKHVIKFKKDFDPVCIVEGFYPPQAKSLATYIIDVDSLFKLKVKERHMTEVFEITKIETKKKIVLEEKEEKKEESYTTTFLKKKKKPELVKLAVEHGIEPDAHNKESLIEAILKASKD